MFRRRGPLLAHVAKIDAMQKTRPPETVGNRQKAAIPGFLQLTCRSHSISAYTRAMAECAPLFRSTPVPHERTLPDEHPHYECGTCQNTPRPSMSRIGAVIPCAALKSVIAARHAATAP